MRTSSPPSTDATEVLSTLQRFLNSRGDQVAVNSVVVSLDERRYRMQAELTRTAAP